MTEKDEKRKRMAELAAKFRKNASEMLSELPEEQRAELCAELTGSMEPLPEDYTDPAQLVASEGRVPQFLIDGFASVFSTSATERGRARGRLSQWLYKKATEGKIDDGAED